MPLVCFCKLASLTLYAPSKYLVCRVLLGLTRVLPPHVCSTIDFETPKNNTVTLREKDTMEQIRLPVCVSIFMSCAHRAGIDGLVRVLWIASCLAPRSHLGRSCFFFRT